MVSVSSQTLAFLCSVLVTPSGFSYRAGSSLPPDPSCEEVSLVSEIQSSRLSLPLTFCSSFFLCLNPPLQNPGFSSLNTTLHIEASSLPPLRPSKAYLKVKVGKFSHFLTIRQSNRVQPNRILLCLNRKTIAFCFQNDRITN